MKIKPFRCGRYHCPILLQISHVSVRWPQRDYIPTWSTAVGCVIFTIYYLVFSDLNSLYLPEQPTRLACSRYSDQGDVAFKFRIAISMRFSFIRRSFFLPWSSSSSVSSSLWSLSLVMVIWYNDVEMLEDQVAYLLQRYLGNYVRGLNKEALKISVWKGS